MSAFVADLTVSSPPTDDVGRHGSAVLTVAEAGIDAVAPLLDRYGIRVIQVADGAPIPGTYWGEPEAGVIGASVYVRADTPLHSLLHEACHLIVAAPERRARIHTDASDSQAEEDACCYLQIVLGDALPGAGRARIMADMDAWGYTFRLGSARAWFEHDADDARGWLQARGLLSEGLRAEDSRLRPICGGRRRCGAGFEGATPECQAGASCAACCDRLACTHRTRKDRTMQRWLKLPDGRYIDANRIMYVGKVETYPRLDDEGNDSGIGYAVYLGTDFPREQQLSVTGTREEILALLKSLLGVTTPS